MQGKTGRRSAIKSYGALLAGMAIPAMASASEEKTNNQTKEERVAFITGGARGIGLETARSLARMGINIVLFDIAGQLKNVKYPLSTPENLRKAEVEIKALGVKCISIQGDVRSLSDLKKAVTKTEQELGRLDILVANAAITQAGGIESFSEEDIEGLLATNIGGVAKSIQAVIPLMKKGTNGRIITLSSIAGRSGTNLFSVYSATKWGVIGLTKSVAIELGPFNIACNAVCPTIIDTPLVNNPHMLGAMSPSNPTKEIIDGYTKTIHTLPVGMLQPKAIADAITFLCSDSASYISGSVIDVNAGYMARNNA